MKFSTVMLMVSYFVPTSIARFAKKKNCFAIAIFNLFLAGILLDGLLRWFRRRCKATAARLITKISCLKKNKD